MVLALLEGGIFVLSVYAAAYLRFYDSFEPGALIAASLGPLMPKALAFAAIMLVSMGAMGLYQASRKESMRNIIVRLATSYALGGVALSMFFYLSPSFLLGRGMMFIAAAISFFMVALLRNFFVKTAYKDVLRRRVLVYGAGEAAADINTLRRASIEHGFYIVGFVHMRGETDVVESHKVIRLKEEPLAAYVEEEHVDEIVVAISDRRKWFPNDELLECRLRGIEITDALTFLERETGKLNLSLLNASWMIFSEGFTQRSMRAAAQRCFDLLASTVLLVLTWPLMLATAAAIMIESGWRAPVLYRQVRVGLGGKPFELLKFRSMAVDAESDGVRWAQVGDARVTRVGAFIRKFRIDELPQLFNVLKGQMRIVGPRPERPEFVSELSNNIPFYKERHRVKPGLAGWAQMNYPYGSSEEDAYKKLEFDLYYVKNHSLFLDFVILLQTAEVVLLGKGAR